MKFLVDTCVLSEATKKRPNAGVVAWLTDVDETLLCTSVLTLGEIRKGIEKLPASKRKHALESWLDRDLRERFAGRVLDVTQDVALRWGQIQGHAEARGETLPVIDSLIAATALVHGLTVVTRNDTDVARSGARTLDPWAE